MIRSARAIASEIALSDAGEFLPSHCDNFRAARMQAAIKITRFLPSSTTMSLAYSSFVRYSENLLILGDPFNSRFRKIPPKTQKTPRLRGKLCFFINLRLKQKKLVPCLTPTLVPFVQLGRWDRQGDAMQHAMPKQVFN